MGLDTEATSATQPRITIRCQFCESWNRVIAARAADRPKCGKCGKPMLIDRPVKLTEETFARTIADSEVPVMVDFYADWCGPCKIMAPFVDQLAAKYQGRALVAKLDTDKAQETAGAFRIGGIPTTIVFVGGKEAARQTGAVPLAGLERLLSQAAPGLAA